MIQAIAISLVLLFLTLSVHYGTLQVVSDRIEAWSCSCYWGLAISVFAISFAHFIEAGLFAAGFWIAERHLDLGGFGQASGLGAMDLFYFSLVNFTTLGRGDIMPTGHLRLIAGVEAFCGFLLITASGSFLLQVMAGRVPLSRRR